MIDLSVIIVNYNVKEFLKNSIVSIQKASTGLETEIIVVDNASDDGSVEEIEQKFPHVKLIANSINVGFGSANNQALKIAGGKFILLLNPDTIVKENTFHELIKFFKAHPEAGMAGCKVLNPDGTLQLACRRSFPGPWTSFTKVTGLSRLFPKSRLFARYNLTYLNENKTYEVDAISGSFMMLTKEVYEKVGGFDSQFFMYGEDLDLCYRIQLSDYKVYYVHSTEIIHYKGESTKRSNIDETKVFYDAMHLFVKKHLASSFLVESILRAAIVFRKLFTFINQRKLSIFSAVIDFLIFASALVIAEEVYKGERWLGFPEFVKPWIFILPALSQTLISSFAGVYKRNSLSVMRTIVALFFGFVFLTSSTFFLKQFAFSRAVVLISYAFSFTGMILWRFKLKLIFKIGVQTPFKRNSALIVGSGNYAQALIGNLKNHHTSFYHLAGYIGLSQKEVGNNIGGHTVLGSLENIRKVIADNKINTVIFSSDEISFDKMFSIVDACRGEGVDFMVAGSEHDYLVGKSAVTMLEKIPLLRVQYNITQAGNRITKNIFDFTVGLLFLIFVYPFVKIFYSFFAEKSDFYKFINQLPQVVLMRKSLVGPDENEYIDGLFLGKIGLTGFWFTEDLYKPDKEEEKKLNIYYARNQNVWLDIEILGKAFSKMFIR
ncbi:MAG: glycosyltransferase [Bacteroidota bacterium]